MRQKQVSELLKKYITSFDKKGLKLFLHFVVDSGNMPVAINIVFCKQTIRAPRSRVCINQLDLDESYQYINELAEEFRNCYSNRPKQFQIFFYLSVLFELYDVECKPIKLLS